MGCGASVSYGEVEDEDEHEHEHPRRMVSPPAEILEKDFSSMLQLQFRGEGLKDGERSFLVVYTRSSGEGLWAELGKTEVCSLDTTWPVWGTIMELQFRVEIMRQMRCEAYKMVHNESLDELRHHRFIGACEFMLTEAVIRRAKVNSSSDGWLRKKLLNIHRKKGEKHPGKICVFANEKQSSKLELYFKLRAKELKSTEFWKRKPDPFFVVSRTKVVGTDEYDCEQVELVPCYRSEVARRTCNARYGNAVITAAQVSHGISEQDFVITIEDWSRLGTSTVLGEAVVNFNDLWKAAGERNLNLPLCKREGPRLNGMLRYSHAQIKRYQSLLGGGNYRRSLSGTLLRFGSRMGSMSFGKKLSKSLSFYKDLRSSSHTLIDPKGSNSDDVNWASMGSENSSSQTRSREGSKSKELARGQTKTSMVSFASFSSESSKQKAMPRWASMAANRSDNEAVKGGVGEKTLLFGPVVGQVSIQEMILDRSYTFLDYVRGGLELRMILGIDFTRSNMDTMNPESLHSLCERGLATAYEDAIVSLGQVLRSYDSSNEYFVYGFGAKIPPSHTVCSNCFALTGDFLYPKVKGLDGILQAYRRALNVVSLHGPSDCVEVLKLAGRFARNFVQEPEKEVLRSTVPPDLIYFVLLILTDGEMESEKQIVEELRNLQAYPISVFFIGIGSKDFSFLRELPNALSLNFDTDFDKPKLENVSKTVSRRVVQFVQYSEYESDPEGLVQATLADLPREIVLYYRMLGVKPRGLERFENKFGELLPTPLPKAAKLELLAAKQRTEDRKTREKVLASKGVREDGASKDTTGSGNRSLVRASSRMSAISAASANVPSTDGDESAVASSRLSLPNAALQEDEEVLQEHQMELSSTSEEDAPKRSKREEDNLPVFLQEERKRLLDEAIAIGYRKHQITRAMRDGIAAATVDVLLDNIRYSGYGKLPSYRDAAISSLPDDAPLPWNPFKTAAENEKKIKQLDVEMEDYGEQLRALTNPAKSELTRQDVLSTAGIFECRRSRIAPPRPPQSPSPKSPPSPPSPSGKLALRRSNSALSNTSPGSPSLRNVEDERREDTGAFEGPGDATKQVEEAARRLRSLRSCAGREGDWPSIKEEDERMHEEDRNIRPPDEPPATLGPPSRSVTKLSSSANSRAYSKGLLE